MDTIVDRIQKIIDANNLKASHVLNELNLSGSTIADWKRGKGKPSAEAIVKFASFFNVSTDYLLLGISSSDHLDATEQEWLDLFHQLSEHDKIECTGFVKGYLAASNSREE